MRQKDPFCLWWNCLVEIFWGMMVQVKVFQRWQWAQLLLKWPVSIEVQHNCSSCAKTDPICTDPGRKTRISLKEKKKGDPAIVQGSPAKWPGTTKMRFSDGLVEIQLEASQFIFTGRWEHGEWQLHRNFLPFIKSLLESIDKVKATVAAYT